MQAEQKKSKQSSAEETLAAGMFYTFAILTVVAFLLRLCGLDWFNSVMDIPEPPQIVQAIVKALLKAFELLLVYKLLIRKNFLICVAISVSQAIIAGFVPVGMFQSLFDLLVMVAVPLIFRKDRGAAIIDTLFLYFIMCLYGALSLIAKFGELNESQIYSFYEAILQMIDYKLFIVTIYAFVKYKGGFRLWKSMKRPLLGL